ncbi:MAG: hypothetical protein CVU89_03140 [Firmicutes bacterium HGW-Firmicutes-14]|nr:MAG: hypothetical protein CVU89_03140 [Firmicutes bacterium HGW-Firmicutes-14]
MFKTLREYTALTPRAVAAALLFIVILDLAVRLYWANLFNDPGSMRLVNQEFETLYALKEEIRKTEGFKVVFAGDSQTYGSAVKNGSETIPGHLERELRERMPGQKVKVFNFSFKGYGMSENFFIINSVLQDDVDLVIYNFSTGWLSREKTLEYDNVVQLSDSYPGHEDTFEKLGINYSVSLREKLRYRAKLAVMRIWSLYLHRADIAKMIFGKPVREKITDLQMAVTNPEEAEIKKAEEQRLYKQWYEKDWEKLLGDVDYKIGKLNVNPYNPQMIFYRMILDELNKHEVPALIYNSPQNTAMLEKYYDFDEILFNNGLDAIHEVTEQQGEYVTHLNFTRLVPDRHFSDTIHLNSDGNRLVAHELADNIEKMWK